MTLYLDTSAVVKLYLEELNSTLVERAVTNARVTATSLITYVEVRSALTRRFREDRYPAASRDQILKRFEHDWNDHHIIAVNELLIRRAAALAQQHRLRAYDAMHLASVLELQQELRRPVTFAAFDATLLRAAKREQLRVLPRR